MCSLGIVCDDLNALKLDVDNFMNQSTYDYGYVVAQSHNISQRVYRLERAIADMQASLDELRNQNNEGGNNGEGRRRRRLQDEESPEAVILVDNTTAESEDDAADQSEDQTIGNLTEVDLALLKAQLMQDIYDDIALNGLMIGSNWLIIQNGTELWVQNFPNATANETVVDANVTDEAAAAAANETQPAEDETADEDDTENEGFLAGGNATAPSRAQSVIIALLPEGSFANVTVPAANQTEGEADDEADQISFRYVFQAGKNVIL